MIKTGHFHQGFGFVYMYETKKVYCINRGSYMSAHVLLNL